MAKTKTYTNRQGRTATVPVGSRRQKLMEKSEAWTAPASSKSESKS